MKTWVLLTTLCVSGCASQPYSITRAVDRFVQTSGVLLTPPHRTIAMPGSNIVPKVFITYDGLNLTNMVISLTVTINSAVDSEEKPVWHVKPLTILPDSIMTMVVDRGMQVLILKSSGNGNHTMVVRGGDIYYIDTGTFVITKEQFGILSESTNTVDVYVSGKLFSVQLPSHERSTGEWLNNISKFYREEILTH